MKKLLSQLFGFSWNSRDSGSIRNLNCLGIIKNTVVVIDSNERRKFSEKINKNIKPTTVFEINPFRIEQKTVGYEFREDNVNFIIKEFKKNESN